MYKTKIFFGTAGCRNAKPADSNFNEWIKDKPNTEIIELRYQHARYGDHSICILYKEN